MLKEIKETVLRVVFQKIELKSQQPPENQHKVQLVCVNVTPSIGRRPGAVVVIVIIFRRRPVVLGAVELGPVRGPIHAVGVGVVGCGGLRGIIAH